jgi:anaerobic magnesium-protoporphyrin IX monomethyl ester cyclase
MNTIDFIMISQNELNDHEEYSRFPVDRIELYENLVFPRMLRYQGRFLSHLDIINKFRYGKTFSEADYSEKRKLLTVWNLPGFAGLHIASYLAQHGIIAAIINNFDAEWDLFCEMYNECSTPPLVGISTTFHLNTAPMTRVVKKLRSLDNTMEIVTGGAFINSLAAIGDCTLVEKTMRKCAVDIVLHAFNSERDLRDLLLFRKGRRSVLPFNMMSLGAKGLSEKTFSSTPEKWHEPVLDDASLFQILPDAMHLRTTAQLRTASGCPFSCAFCSYPTAARGSHLMNLATVDKIIGSAKRMRNITKLVFIDDTFNVPPERFKSLCGILAKYGMEWFSFLRVQFITAKIADRMKESGCKGVFLGIESANDGILQTMHKQAAKSDFQRGIALLKEREITTMGAFVVGFPGETEETIDENVQFIETAGLDFYTIKDFYYITGTPVDVIKHRYNLSGNGATWKHNTMDSTTAKRYRMEMFKTIRNCIHVEADASLWHLITLYDQGFAMDLIKDIQRCINTVIRDQLDGNFHDDTHNFHQLECAINRRGTM